MTTMYLLDTQEKANPGSMGEHFCVQAWGGKASILVMQKRRFDWKSSTYVLGSPFLVLDHDDNGKDMLNTRHVVISDQSRRHLGDFVVTGVRAMDGQAWGHIPNRKMVAKVQK